MGSLWLETSSSNYCSDEDLVRMAHAGSRHATELLLSRYRALVESKARTYFLVGADHDDVVQEGMIGLYKAIRDFRGDRLAHFRAFADLCVTRQIITAVKTATRQKHLPLNAYLSLHHGPSSDPDGEPRLLDCLPDACACNPPARIFDPHDPSGRLEAARHTLSRLESQVLDCYLQGKSYREMAVELKRPAKAVDNALQRVKRKLAESAPV